MNQMQIRNGVPIPEAKARAGSNMQLLAKMKVGDSVYFDEPISKKAQRFYRVASRLGCRIVLRKEGDGIAMWKTTECTNPITVSVTNGSGDAPKKATKKRAAPAKKKAKAKR
jgi:hypothetical protein